MSEISYGCLPSPAHLARSLLGEEFTQSLPRMLVNTVLIHFRYRIASFCHSQGAILALEVCRSNSQPKLAPVEVCRSNSQPNCCLCYLFILLTK